MERRNWKKRRLNFHKCSFCRRDKKKCQPEDYSWPQEKCSRCDEKGFPCSPSQRAASAEESPSSEVLKHSGTPKEDDELRRILDLSMQATRMWQLSEFFHSSHRIGSVLNKIEHAIGSSYVLQLRSQTYENVMKDLVKDIVRIAQQHSDRQKHYPAMAALQLLSRLMAGAPDQILLQGLGAELLRGQVQHLCAIGDFGAAAVMQEGFLARLTGKGDSSCEGMLKPALKDYMMIYMQIQEHLAETPHFSTWAFPPLHRLVRLFNHSRPLRAFVDISDKVDINEKNFLGGTALHIAAERNSAGSIRFLVSKNARIDARDMFGHTPVHTAVLNGSLDALEALLENNAKVDYSILLHYAVLSGNEAVLQLLLSQSSLNPDFQTPSGKAALVLAVQGGEQSMVRMLLGAQADANMKDNLERAPLLISASLGHEGITELLLNARGIDPTVRGQSGRTPLSYAAQKGHAKIVKLLLQALNIAPNWKDMSGRTPLSYAARRGHKEAVELLLDDSHVNRDLRDENGRSALSYAAKRGHEEIVQMLLDKADLVQMLKIGMAFRQLPMRQKMAMKQWSRSCLPSQE